MSEIEIELDDDDDDDDDELEEDEELEKNPLFSPKVSTSQLLESAVKVPLVVTFRFKITSRSEYSADLTELEMVPTELNIELKFEAALESSFQPMYCWSLVPIAADFATALAQPLPLKVQSTTAP